MSIFIGNLSAATSTTNATSACASISTAVPSTTTTDMDTEALAKLQFREKCALSHIDSSNFSTKASVTKASTEHSCSALAMSSSQSDSYSFSPVVTLSDVLELPSLSNSSMHGAWPTIVDDEMELPPMQNTEHPSKKALDQDCSIKIKTIVHTLHVLLHQITSSKEAEKLYTTTLTKLQNIIETPSPLFRKQKADFVAHVAKEVINGMERRATTPLPQTSIFSACLSFPSLPSLDSKTSKSQCVTPTARVSSSFQFPTSQTTASNATPLPRAKTPTLPSSSLELEAGRYSKVLCNLVLIAVQNICEIYSKAQEELVTH